MSVLFSGQMRLARCLGFTYFLFLPLSLLLYIYLSIYPSICGALSLILPSYTLIPFGSSMLSPPHPSSWLRGLLFHREKKKEKKRKKGETLLDTTSAWNVCIPTNNGTTRKERGGTHALDKQNQSEMFESESRVGADVTSAHKHTRVTLR